MTDPKTDTKAIPDKVVIPPKATSLPSATAKGKDMDTRTMSSVGAELHPDAPVTKVDGKVTIDASEGTSNKASAAPQPTPSEAVIYPPTGGLPDTGPNSKYALGDERGLELYNRDGERVDADGRLIDEFGDRIPDKGVDETRRVNDKNLMKQERFVSASTKAEMDAGKRALSNR